MNYDSVPQIASLCNHRGAPPEKMHLPKAPVTVCPFSSQTQKSPPQPKPLEVFPPTQNRHFDRSHLRSRQPEHSQFPPTRNRHFDRSCSLSYREQRSGEIRFSTPTAHQPPPRTYLCSSTPPATNERVPHPSRTFVKSHDIRYRLSRDMHYIS